MYWWKLSVEYQEGKKLLETQSEEGTVVPWSLHLPDSNGEDPRGAPYHFGRGKERLIIVKYTQRAPLLGKDHREPYPAGERASSRP